MVNLMTDDEIEAARPTKRADCIRGPRPCPWVSCRWHLFFDYGRHKHVGRTDGVPNIDPLEMTDTCALDLAEDAERGFDVTLERIGSALGISRERVRQIENKAQRRLDAALLEDCPDMAIEDWIRKIG